MYFDFGYYGKVLAHVWKLRGWRGRNRMLFRLLVLVPLGSALHAVFFLLDYLFFPRLLTMEVRAPVFVIGHARSGTTLMHRLMAADGERFSYFLYWETFFPSLLEKKIIRALGSLDQRLGGPIRRRLEAWDEKTFGPFRHMHDMSLWNSEEDQFVMKAAFVTQQWSLDIPIMDKVDVFHLDTMPNKRGRWMRHYRECVKRQLLLNGGDRVHLAKNPVMCGWVDAILETFPDARFVTMMRDPANCIPSVLKLVELTWKGKGWSRAEYANSLRILTDVSFESFRHPRQVLAQYPRTPQVVVDYRNLTSAPRATVHAVYQALGLDLRQDYDTWLQQQEEREKGHSTRFEYRMQDYDLSAERLVRELADFYADYDWPRPLAVAGDDQASKGASA